MKISNDNQNYFIYRPCFWYQITKNKVGVIYKKNHSILIIFEYIKS
jgi:hypothetical protein